MRYYANFYAINTYYFLVYLSSLSAKKEGGRGVPRSPFHSAVIIIIDNEPKRLMPKRRSDWEWWLMVLGIPQF